MARELTPAEEVQRYEQRHGRSTAAKRKSPVWLWVMTLLGALGFVLSQAGFGHGNPGLNPDDYSTCSDLATYPGTDVSTAKCVDENGSVVDFAGWQSRH